MFVSSKYRGSITIPCASAEDRPRGQEFQSPPAGPQANRMHGPCFLFSRRTSWKLDSNRFTLAHQQMLREGSEVLDLTISNPTRAGFAFDETTILDALRNPKSLDYDPQPKGLRRSRETVAEYYKCGA